MHRAGWARGPRTSKDAGKSVQRCIVALRRASGVVQPNGLLQLLSNVISEGNWYDAASIL